MSLENDSPQRSGLRSAILALALSASGLVGIALNEGYSERAIIPVPGDVPTIGFGTTQGVKLGDKTTPPQALARALQDVNRFEAQIKQCVRVPLHQYEYDTYVSFAYNVGSGAFCKSTLVKKLNTGDYASACKELLRWMYFQGKNCARAENARLCGGLAKRRQEEYRQCMGPLA